MLHPFNTEVIGNVSSYVFLVVNAICLRMENDLVEIFCHIIPHPHPGQLVQNYSTVSFARRIFTFGHT